VIDRLSIEITRRCPKACAFCYNGSGPDGETSWSADEVVAFVLDVARHGVRAVSFGGGEPLTHPGLPAMLAGLEGTVGRAVTTSGLADDSAWNALIAARPDKVHVSIHRPGNVAEVRRVIAQVHDLAERGVPSGVNLLVAASERTEARAAADALRDAGIGPDRVVVLPMRGRDTPTPAELAQVGGTRFQSMTCLTGCGRSPRFASVDYARRAAWCSYTTTRRPLETLDAHGLARALEGLGLAPCGP
jgi:MoaA/NifB/PqqE/SkfB family radical SAM enzyme